MTQHDKNRSYDVIVTLPKIDFVYCGVIANYIPHSTVTIDNTYHSTVLIMICMNSLQDSAIIWASGDVIVTAQFAKNRFCDSYSRWASGCVYYMDR